jgi:hypothetical protein
MRNTEKIKCGIEKVVCGMILHSMLCIRAIPQSALRIPQSI